MQSLRVSAVSGGKVGHNSLETKAWNPLPKSQDRDPTSAILLVVDAVLAQEVPKLLGSTTLMRRNSAWLLYGCMMSYVEDAAGY